MRIVLIESQISWENKQKNIEILKNDLTEITVKGNPDMVCLPEMSFTGFSMNVEETKDDSGDTVRQVIDISQNYDVNISFGWVEEGKAGFYNHYTVVGRGSKRLDYVKIHPFSYGGEADIFVGGDSVSVAEIGGFKTGIQICYDLRFPEVFRILSGQADLILVPANWPTARVSHWDTLLAARAIENQIYIAGINCIGNMNCVEYPGHTCIISPDGEKCSFEYMKLNSGNHAYLYELDNDVEKFRKAFPVKQDRREDLYRRLR